MIPRYTRPEMASIWEPQTRFNIWFEIEAHAADALADLGVIPKDAAKTIWAKAKDAVFNVARIDEIERETKHDVIAFLTHLAEIVGPEARFVHQGMTSSDVLDTCLNVQLTRAADILLKDLDKLGPQLDTMVGQWGAGDPAALAETMNEGLAETPDVAKTLLWDRNARWAEHIEARMAQPGTVFVAVGAGHLAGAKSVQDYLKERGLKVTRIQ
ncbi:MAG: TraB/GumN family protein [Rhizobiales bacterium]|nr:TraB/GumN family protein [Hyphomicrobiales bacterium]